MRIVVSSVPTRRIARIAAGGSRSQGTSQSAIVAVTARITATSTGVRVARDAVERGPGGEEPDQGNQGDGQVQRAADAEQRPLEVLWPIEDRQPDAHTIAQRTRRCLPNHHADIASPRRYKPLRRTLIAAPCCNNAPVAKSAHLMRSVASREQERKVPNVPGAITHSGYRAVGVCRSVGPAGATSAGSGLRLRTARVLGLATEPDRAVSVGFLLPDWHDSFRRVMTCSQAAKASWRCGDDTAITTLASPMVRRPTRWMIATRRSPQRSSISSATRAIIFSAAAG